MIYLDNASTTFPKPEQVYKRLDFANRNQAFNSGRGSYQESRNISLMIEETRSLLAELVKTEGKNVIFSSSATEALNLVIGGINIIEGDNIYITPFEHNAVIRPLYELQKKVKFKISILPFDKATWIPNLEKISNLFAINPPKALFVSHISNVTGYILPYESLFQLSSEYTSINVLDCAQSLGVLNPKNTFNVNYIIFAGHKSLYASFGVGGFIKLGNDKLSIFKSGGTGSDSLNTLMPLELPTRYEAGSINGVAIAGLNESLKWLSSVNILEHEKELTNYLIYELKKLKKVTLFIPDNYDVNSNLILGILSINILGYLPEEVSTILSEDFDIKTRAGFHCSSMIHNFIGSNTAGGTVRISIGYFTSIDQLANFIDIIKEIINE